MPRLITLLATLACAVPLAAQETTGDIRGRVLDSLGAAVQDVEIVAVSTDLVGVRRAISARDGMFLLLSLPPGSYSLRLRAIGYRPVAVQQVPVRLGRTTGLETIRMERAVESLAELVVTAPPVTLDPVRTTIGATLDSTELRALPGDRDFRSLIASLPHVNTSYLGDAPNSAGATGLENMYFIDGVNVTAPWKATEGTSLPSNFIQSVEVRAGGYEAEYGRALGAIVNAVTHTGGNRFEVSSFGYLTGSALAFEPRAQPTLRETGARSYDVGVRVSGPVARDRLWYSAAWNPRVDRSTRDISGLGGYVDRDHSDVFAGKLTWRPSANASIELSVFGDPSTHHQVEPPGLSATGLVPLNADPYLTRVTTGGTAASLRAVRAFGPSLLVEATASAAQSRQDLRGETDLGRSQPIYFDYVTHVLSGGALFAERVTQGRVAGTMRATLTLDRHRVVAGGEYENGRVARASLKTRGDIARTDTSSYLVHLESQNGTFHVFVPTLFLQDSWRATSRLTINAGVRWSRQSVSGASGRVVQRLSDEWQPRLGFSWQLGPAGRQRLFGSYGRFYQQQPLNLASLNYVTYVYREWYYAADPRTPGTAATDSLDLTTTESDFAHTGDGATAERTDEFTLGYERLLGARTVVTVRAMHRTLGTAFLQGTDFSTYPGFFLGTPGEGALSWLPRARRDYTALEVSAQGAGRRVSWRASYVLSRSWGNYPGLHGADLYFSNPGVAFGLAMRHQAMNSTGLLPNDRTHVVKAAATLQASRIITLGGVMVLASGTPLTEFGAGPDNGGLTWPLFLARRGSSGRTPSVLDLNLRATWMLPAVRSMAARIVLDALHVGNFRRAVRIDQQHYLGIDSTGTQVNPNPTYGRALAYQPPMAARIGVEVGF